MKIKLVKQKHKAGCAPACIAMVTGQTYDFVVSKFWRDFDKGGLSVYDTIDYIIEQGFIAIRKTSFGYNDVISSNKELSKPFAPVHILKVKQYSDSGKIAHAIVMDSKGKIFCPSGEKNSINDFYEILDIVGFYKELGKKNAKRKRNSNRKSRRSR